MEEKDYKKLYEDVLERAKNGLKDKNYYLSQSAKEVTEFLFPQLKETEDEKIRRELTRFLINFNNGYYSKPSETEIDSWVKWINKKCGQKPTDKAEPKFKVGDWITNGGLLVGQVTSFDGEYYHYMCEGIEQPLHISNAYNWHLWTIQDAKNGDVLAYVTDEEDLWIMIYWSLYEPYEGHVHYHALLVNDNFSDKGTCCICIDDLKPATKEQRDLLFQKMKEAGYEWDAEKKELKKIEQKSAWSEEDETGWTNTMIMIKEVASRHYTKDSIKLVVDWLESIKDRVQSQPKQKWSEEDEKKLNDTIFFLNEFNEVYHDDAQNCIKWLKSFKPQQNQYDKGYNDGYSAAKYNQWKPTDKQMENFRMLLDYNIGVFDYAKFMSANSLYDDLKKNLID